MQEMCRAWFEDVGKKQARHTLRYILRQVLLPDGTIKMTEGRNSDLTAFFTNFLNSSEALKRDGLLTSLERDMIMNKLCYGMSNKEMENTHFYCRAEINKKIATALDKILLVSCWE